MEVVSLMLLQLYPVEFVHYIGGWVDPRVCLGATEKRKIWLLPGSELQSSSQWPVAIPSELSWF
jgi:hypothetical protein